MDEIICIVDRSGSMAAIKNDAIGGFNTFLEDQKKVKGEANLTFIQFDDQYEMVHNNVPLQNVPPLNEKIYIPRGMTALLDAIGKTINDVGDRLNKTPEDKRPKKVIVCIVTDGQENWSKEFKYSQIKEMIEHQKEKYSWEFIYIGANQDAFDEGTKLGVDLCNTATYVADKEGINKAYTFASSRTTTYRSKA